MCRRDQWKKVTLLDKLWALERTTVLVRYIVVWMQRRYHTEAASLPPPIAAEIKADAYVLECFFFLLD